MSDMDYTSAVASVRVREVSLFSASTIDQLMACRTYEDCLQFLADKGWGDGSSDQDLESMLEYERRDAWQTVRELVTDPEIFKVLDYPDLFHNLKAAIKETCTDGTYSNIYYEDTDPSPEEMKKMVSDRNFVGLPEEMTEAAQNAVETFLHTGDGQLCDIIIDRACLEAIHAAGEASEDEFIRDYAETSVAIADIKIAVRSMNTGKPLSFIQDAMADCSTLNLDALGHAAMSGLDAVRSYLNGTAYAEGGDALAESASAFDCWCDNMIIRCISSQKLNTFSVGPVVAYALARENEIKTVRIILSGKLNNMPDSSIRERIREMYV